MASVTEEARMFLDRIMDRSHKTFNRLRQEGARLNAAHVDELQRHVSELYKLLGDQRTGRE